MLQDLQIFQLMQRSLGRYRNDASQPAKTVQKMYNSYHSPWLNLLQDEIIFHEDGQYMKRQYQQFEYHNKISCLSDYYQYHRELPRIFQKDISSIIQNYQEDLRNVQFKFVSRKMKEDGHDQGGFTTREKTHRPVQKVIKNIELSYYNFQKKNIKKHKEIQSKDKIKQSILARNKKSMPVLPLYHYQQKQHHKGPQLKQNAIPPTIKILGIRDNNRINRKQKNKDPSKKVSVNNSEQSPKNLSRSKSKSNLATAYAFDQAKRNSVKAFQNSGVSRNDKVVRSAHGSLQKAQSTKNIMERKATDVRKIIKLPIQKLQSKKEEGIKSMFKRVVQTKKMIKISR